MSYENFKNILLAFGLSILILVEVLVILLLFILIILILIKMVRTSHLWVKKICEKRKKKSRKKIEEEIKLANSKRLIEMLSRPSILEWEVNLIIEKLSNCNLENIYGILASEKIETLITLKGVLTKISEENKDFDRNANKFYFALVYTIFLNYLANIFSNISVAESKLIVPFYEGTTKFLINGKIIAFSVTLAFLILMGLLPWAISKSKKKLDSTVYVLINSLDYIIELKKKGEEN